MKIDFSRVVSASDKAEAVRKDESNRITARRNVAIASGIRVAGVSVQTDDHSQQRITGAALAAALDPQTEINWKTADGSFVTLDASQIIAIAQAVRLHVQACFDREADLLSALDAGLTYTLDEGWPT